MVSNMWKSPIEIQQDIVRQVDMVIEDGVMKAIQRFDINVDKEELLKALQYDRGQYEKGYQDGLNEGKWIPCGERLPEDEKEVLITIFEDSIYLGWYDLTDKQWRTEEFDCEEGEVIAWMPLPEPYKGE